MQIACSLGLAPGTSGNDLIDKGGLTAPHRRPRNRVKIRVRRRWLATIAAGTVLSGGGAAAQDPALIEKGRKLFMEETFGGNGRTCAT